MKVQMLIGAAALAMTASALAAPTLTDGPPVESGDMGCLIATGWIAMAADKAAAKPDATPERRASAQKIAAQSFADNAFYLGRMTMLGKEKLTKDLYSDAFNRFAKLSSTDQTAIIKICKEWARDAKLGVIEPWSAKP